MLVAITKPKEIHPESIFFLYIILHSLCCSVSFPVHCESQGVVVRYHLRQNVLTLRNNVVR